MHTVLYRGLGHRRVRRGCRSIDRGKNDTGCWWRGMEALCEIILTDITTLKERPFYIGLLGLMWARGSILAPIVGGLFVQYVSWRWIAWINLPLMGVALVLLPLFLNMKMDRSSVWSKLKRVDWLGITLLMVGLRHASSWRWRGVARCSPGEAGRQCSHLLSGW